jgi:hypothetical protein
VAELPEHLEPELNRLHQLHDAGAISDQEFRVQRRELLAEAGLVTLAEEDKVELRSRRRKLWIGIIAIDAVVAVAIVVVLLVVLR